MSAEDYPWYGPHLEWARGGAGGQRADLRDADLRGADLRDADLQLANLRGADLRDADLRGADLRDADLHDAILWGADLRDAILRDALLRDADLRCADIRGADLRGADLRGSVYSAATRWPTQAMVLLAAWGDVSPALCRDLMGYCAANHADPEAFRRWAESGSCPYDGGVVFERMANFSERRDLWDEALLAVPPKSALELVQELFAEILRWEDAP